LNIFERDDHMSAQKGAYKVPLAALDTAGGVLSIANPEGVPLIVTKVVIDLITKSTGAGTLDVGIAANGTTTADNLIDGLDVNAAAGAFGSPSGTNGLPAKKWGVTEYLTASKATGNMAGLVGYAYIEYIRV
jgi:hypothetical protein